MTAEKGYWGRLSEAGCDWILSEDIDETTQESIRSAINLLYGYGIEQALSSATVYAMAAILTGYITCRTVMGRDRCSRALREAVKCMSIAVDEAAEEAVRIVESAAGTEDPVARRKLMESIARNLVRMLDELLGEGEGGRG